MKQWVLLIAFLLVVTIASHADSRSPVFIKKPVTRILPKIPKNLPVNHDLVSAGMGNDADVPPVNTLSKVTNEEDDEKDTIVSGNTHHSLSAAENKVLHIFLNTYQYSLDLHSPPPRQ
jgi:hypothetical protein